MTIDIMTRMQDAMCVWTLTLVQHETQTRMLPEWPGTSLPGM